MGVVAINLVEFDSLLLLVTTNFSNFSEKENAEVIVEGLFEPKLGG